jgi:hypothetical protein
MACRLLNFYRHVIFVVVVVVVDVKHRYDTTIVINLSVIGWDTLRLEIFMVPLLRMWHNVVVRDLLTTDLV